MISSLPRYISLITGITVAILAFSLSAPSAARIVDSFTLEDNSGSSWQLSDHPQQPKLLMFWATWCPPCKKLFPTIQSIHEQYAEKGLNVIAISVYDDGDTLEYAKSRNLTMTILKNGDHIAESLGVPGTPTVILLDGENNVRYGAVNPPPFDTELYNVLDALVLEKAAT